jgi:hypothetical protein
MGVANIRIDFTLLEIPHLSGLRYTKVLDSVAHKTPEVRVIG